ncbi:MAG: extracellular solute-binding protein [Cellvibrionaceae bacterium]
MHRPNSRTNKENIFTQYCDSSTLILIIMVLLPLNSNNLWAFEASPDQKTIKSHAIAMHGEPKYSKNFSHFSYTSPKAKKGGNIRLYGFGTFDSLNEFIAKGNPADNLELLYDSLTKQAMDEPFTQYGLVAHTIEYPEDRSWVIFHLRSQAKFHDGKNITADDVVFSFNLLIEKGNPAYKFFYADVEKVEAINANKVKFSFRNTQNRELALSVGQLPIFPQHFWQDKEFDKSSLETPLGSGPYRIQKVDPGRKITYERVKEYWGKDLAINRYLYNFDHISIDYYRDMSVAVEALKADEYDYRWENSSKFWATAYDIPAVKKGDLITRELAHKANSGIQAFVFNLRKPLFQDIELRKAISYAFDFEWSNKTLFYGAYDRSNSYFSNSDFAATDLPNTKELALLEPYREQLPESVFTQVYQPPKSDGKNRNRTNLRKAKKLLDNAGYKVIDNQLYNSKKQAIQFEILLVSPGFERIVNPFIKGLSRLGITANIRLVDTSQYINRSRSFDFDMLVKVFQQSESPGNEQRNLWGSEAAKTQGSQNIIGIQNPVIDSLVANIVNARAREDLVIATRALDRVLLHNHYVIPQWFKASNRIAYWDRFGIPEIVPIYDRYYRTGIYTWWYDKNKADNIKQVAKGEDQTKEEKQ